MRIGILCVVYIDRMFCTVSGGIVFATKLLILLSQAKLVRDINIYTTSHTTKHYHFCDYKMRSWKGDLYCDVITA